VSLIPLHFGERSVYASYTLDAVPIDLIKQAPFDWPKEKKERVRCSLKDQLDVQVPDNGDSPHQDYLYTLITFIRILITYETQLLSLCTRHNGTC